MTRVRTQGAWPDRPPSCISAGTLAWCLQLRMRCPRLNPMYLVINNVLTADCSVSVRIMRGYDDLGIYVVGRVPFTLAIRTCFLVGIRRLLRLYNSQLVITSASKARPRVRAHLRNEIESDVLPGRRK